MHTVRKPKLTEIATIKQLLDNAAEGGAVLRRPLMELYENVRDFYTYADEAGVGGCCALHIDTVDLAEIRSLVVRPDLRGQAIGKALLSACLEEARVLNIDRVYCLTRNPEFFGKHGFAIVDKHELPHKVFNDCVRCSLFPDCDEIAMVRPINPSEMFVADPKADACGVLGFLGFGNMGAAIAKGLLAARIITPDRIWAYDVAEEKRAEAAGIGATVAASPEALAAGCDTLILAVKPQAMAEALAPLKAALTPKTRVISIAAGISTAYLQSLLGADIHVVRVMPNTPAMVNTGAAGIALSANCTETDADVARRIFDAIGVAEMVPETQIDAVTALSGSGPAYFFYMVECLIDAAAAQGMDRGQATRLAAQTMLGAGRLLDQSGEPASVLRERVTSKGGTTAAALESFRKNGFDRVIAEGVAAAAARSKELGK
ncbi:MAG: pyrroline-5-carboxylate reductase [Candidatus Hydrogenedentes bacterium]|nr:pyrroline-5-carboxylate reductase [Candidatus Hydrogenedentota bacterium]